MSDDGAQLQGRQCRARLFSKSSLARLQGFWNSSIYIYQIKKKNLFKSTCQTGSFTCPGRARLVVLLDPGVGQWETVSPAVSQGNRSPVTGEPVLHCNRGPAAGETVLHCNRGLAAGETVLLGNRSPVTEEPVLHCNRGPAAGETVLHCNRGLAAGETVL